jgi:predicted  nucleic acid-binding Zn-ribbon protein
MAAKTMEKRVADLEELVEHRVVNMRFLTMRAHLDALDARVGTVEVKIDALRTELQSLKSEVRALPKLLAEMLDERAKRGG